jgi:hypothetical protein
MTLCAERIEIPFSGNGRRCYEVFEQIALRRLQSAREATRLFVLHSMPNAEVTGETAMSGGKYTVIVALPSGKRKTLTYDYRTKEVELNDSR